MCAAHFSPSSALFGGGLNTSISDMILSSRSWQPQTGTEFTAISHGELEYLEQDGQYLMLLDPSDGGPYIEPSRVGKNKC